jgi:hypothetical protein
VIYDKNIGRKPRKETFDDIKTPAVQTQLCDSEAGI